MQIQTTQIVKPTFAATGDKKPAVVPPEKPIQKIERPQKYLRYGPVDLQQSIQRKRARRAALEERIRVLTIAIDERENRLKEISKKQ